MTYRELLDTVTKKLLATGIDGASTDAWRLFEEIGGMSRSRYFLEAETLAPDDFQERIYAAAEKRAEHIPLQYITGHQDFFGCDIEVSSDTLIPRFDTEVLVDTALSFMKKDKTPAILDVCTGTGCILTACGKELQAAGISADLAGCDISVGAVELAGRNARNNGVKASFFQGDLIKALVGTDYENKEFDYILSNPPYIKSSVIPGLSEEVREHEPMTALDGGEDGLYFYRQIIKEAPRHLKNDGCIFFEIGYDQGAEVSELLKETGFCEVTVVKDLAGLDRVVYGRLPGQKDR